jgi:hypothetical protein
MASIFHAHTSIPISHAFMKQMQSGLLCLVGKEAEFYMTCNVVQKINFLLLFHALKYQSVCVI